MLLFAMSVIGVLAVIFSVVLAAEVSITLGYVLSVVVLFALSSIGIGVRLSSRFRRHVQDWLDHLDVRSNIE